MFGIIGKTDPKEQESAKAALNAKLKFINSEMERLSKEGPYFMVNNQ